MQVTSALVVAALAAVMQLCVCAADQGSSPTAADSPPGDDVLTAVLAHFRDHGVLTPAQYEHGVANGQHIRENGLHSLRSRDDLKNDGFGINERDPHYRGVEDKHNIFKTGGDTHILLTLSGNHSGFLAEVQVALKSVVLNAPPRSPMFIHMMCDKLAYDAMDGVFAESGLEGTGWETQITIVRYNVEGRIAGWSKRIDDAGLKQRQTGHTFGAYLRLFAHEVLPPDTKTVVYMDSDAVFLANVQEVTKHAVPHVIFQWGASKCDGFALLNMQRMGEFWDTYLDLAVAKYKSLNDGRQPPLPAGDQSMLRLVHEYFPDEVGPLPDAWDLSMANELWKVASHLVEKRPRAGMLHFNGGGGSKESYFSKGITSDGFRTVNYYVQLPWSWVHFLGESRCAATQSCRPLKLKNK